MRGLFISFEGVEGSGKTTILQALAEYLQREKRIALITTREPGGTSIAEKIRSIILNPEHTKLDARTEALLYAAARREHLVDTIIPALAAGQFVLCDRYVDSSLAYQGYARGLGLEEVWKMNQFAMDGCLPQLTIYFDLDPALGLERIKRDNSREVNRLDLEALSFHQKVREGYFLLKKRFPDRIVEVDASGSIDEVFSQVKELVEHRIFR